MARPEQYVIIDNARRRIKDKYYWIGGEKKTALEEHVRTKDGAQKLVYQRLVEVKKSVKGLVPWSAPNSPSYVYAWGPDYVNEDTPQRWYAVPNGAWIHFKNTQNDPPDTFWGIDLHHYDAHPMAETRCGLNVKKGSKYWVYGRIWAHGDNCGIAGLQVSHKPSSQIIASETASDWAVYNPTLDNNDWELEGSRIYTAESNRLTLRWLLLDCPDSAYFVVLLGASVVDVTELYNELVDAGISQAAAESAIKAQCEEKCKQITDLNQPIELTIRVV